MEYFFREIRKMEVQDSRLLKASEPVRLVFKTESIKRFRAPTFKQS